MNKINREKKKRSVFFPANGAGCINRIQSLVNNKNYLGAGIISLQETHFSRTGKLNKHLKDFDIFEAIRKKRKRAL